MSVSRPIARFYRIGTAACVLACAACAKGSASDAAPDVDKLPQLEISEQLRIGSRDNPDTGFAAVGGVDVDRDGQLFVFEPQRVQIRVYDPGGVLRRTIGRQGSGPGEFEQSIQFGVVGDTVWTYEYSVRRMTLFDRTGKMLSANRIDGVAVDLQSPGSIGRVLPKFMRADGHFIGDMTLYTGRQATGDWPVKPTDTVSVPRVLFAPSGAAIDTLGWSPRPPPASGSSEWVEIGSTRYIVPRPPSREPTSIAVEDGWIIVDSPSPRAGEPGIFSVTRLTMSRDTTYHRRFSYSPRPYDAATLDSLVWRSVRTPGGGIPIINGVLVPRPTRPDSMAVFDALRSKLAFPEHQPPLQFSTVHEDGGLWIRRQAVGETVKWLVLNPDGSARGEITLPARRRIAWSSGDTVWMVESDDMDVPWLVKYQMTVAK
jgi:hypothetical protein